MRSYINKSQIPDTTDVPWIIAVVTGSRKQDKTISTELTEYLKVTDKWLSKKYFIFPLKKGGFFYNYMEH